MVEVHHPGFEDQEFDAQLEFFRYYDLPPLHVPLLSVEFSRPLFLRLMCEGIKDLSKRSQKENLRDLASGEKSMTYVRGTRSVVQAQCGLGLMGRGPL